MVAHLAAPILLGHRADIIRNNALDAPVIPEGIGENALVYPLIGRPLHRHGNRIPVLHPGALREGDLLPHGGEIVHPAVRVPAGAVLPGPFVPVEGGEPAIQPKPSRARQGLSILHGQIQPVVSVLPDGGSTGGHADIGVGALPAVIHLNTVAVPIPQLRDGLLTGIGDLAFRQIGGEARFLGREGFPRSIGGNILLRLALGAGDQTHRHKGNGNHADKAHPEAGLAVVENG